MNCGWTKTLGKIESTSPRLILLLSAHKRPHEPFVIRAIGLSHVIFNLPAGFLPSLAALRCYPSPFLAKSQPSASSFPLLFPYHHFPPLNPSVSSTLPSLFPAAAAGGGVGVGCGPPPPPPPAAPVTPRPRCPRRVALPFCLSSSSSSSCILATSPPFFLTYAPSLPKAACRAARAQGVAHVKSCEQGVVAPPAAAAAWHAAPALAR